ncbi:MAG: DUF92 domain-containing protein [Chloroflexi bacterium]|nr:DUF92 domain-containing protein [Chloroflexota bacterium]
MTLVWEILGGAAAGSVLAHVGRRARMLDQGSAWSLAAAVTALSALGGWLWGATMVLTALAVGLATSIRRRQSSWRLPPPPPLSIEAICARLAWPVSLAVLSRFTPLDLFVAYTGGLAAACADAWATHFGILSKVPPRTLAGARAAVPGMPGAISTLGILASAGGSGLIGFAALACLSLQPLFDHAAPMSRALWLPLSALVGGFSGSLFDSFLAGTAQALYYCENCGTFSETPIHSCGEPARHVRGWTWMTNEAVDASASVIGAGIASATMSLLAWL